MQVRHENSKNKRLPYLLDFNAPSIVTRTRFPFSSKHSSSECHTRYRMRGRVSFRTSARHRKRRASVTMAS